MYLKLHLLFLLSLPPTFFKVNLYFIYIFFAALGLHCCAWAFSSCSERCYSSLRCVGFSLWWLLLLQSRGSRRAGFRSCGPRAQLLRSMWDLPRPGLEPVSPTLAGGFLTTAPPGKSRPPIFIIKQLHLILTVNFQVLIIYSHLYCL